MADALEAVNSIVLCSLSRQTVGVKKIVISLASFLVLSGCGPVPFFYQEGGSVSRMQSELLSCEVDALAKAPVATQVRQSPPRYIPGRRYCRSDGRCYRDGGFFVSGEFYSVDVNARLRGDLKTQCMSDKGYQRIELSRCTSDISFPNAPDDGSRMPALSDASCANKDDSGKWRIITP